MRSIAAHNLLAMADIKGRFKRWLLRRGIHVSRRPGQFDLVEHRLDRLKQAGFSPRYAVDGGAADGEWTRLFKRVFPEAAVLCVEPRDECMPQLATLQRGSRGISVAQALLGNGDGTAVFHEHAEQSSMLCNARGQHFGRATQRPLTTLDALIGQTLTQWPDLIKLDLQGAELECLSGASKCLQHAQVVMLEVSFLPLYSHMPLLADVVAFMSARQFQCYDIAGLLRRPLDDALAQGDFIFLRRDSDLLSDSRWSGDSSWS